MLSLSAIDACSGLNVSRKPIPRSVRAATAGYSCHILNRGNARAQVFQRPEDYDAFIGMMGEASVRIPMRILAYCLMPNHFDPAIWPREEGDLRRFMHWLLTTHVAVTGGTITPAATCGRVGSSRFRLRRTCTCWRC
jgi:REP element-mobilizing transposase RayT